MTATVLKLMDSDIHQRTRTGPRQLALHELESLQQPPFHRPVLINHRVKALVETLKANGGIISGVITLGRLPHDPLTLYKVDGSHRIEAAKMSGLSMFSATVATVDFLDIGEMAAEFVKLNSWLVKFRPDNILKAQEANNPLIKTLRERCSFIGYESVRRNPSSKTVLAVSTVLRAWFDSERPTPAGNSASAPELVERLDADNVETLIEFLLIAHNAWGQDRENYRMWMSLNLTLCMWLYRQLVLKPMDTKRRFVRLDKDQFGRCLMSASAAKSYSDWMVGRTMQERNRAPCYTRLRVIFLKRLGEEGIVHPRLPQPEWYSGK